MFYYEQTITTIIIIIH